MAFTLAIVASRQETAVRLHVGVGQAVETQPYQLRRYRHGRTRWRAAPVATPAAHRVEPVLVRMATSPGRVAWRGRPASVRGRAGRGMRTSSGCHETFGPSTTATVPAWMPVLAGRTRNCLPLARRRRAWGLRTGVGVVVLRVTKGDTLLGTTGEEVLQQTARRTSPERSGRRQLLAFISPRAPGGGTVLHGNRDER